MQGKHIFKQQRLVSMVSEYVMSVVMDGHRGFVLLITFLCVVVVKSVLVSQYEAAKSKLQLRECIWSNKLATKGTL